MHYRNGREAKNGDMVVQLSNQSGKEGTIVNVGILHDCVQGNEFWYGGIAPTLTTPGCACMCDCMHIEDIATMLKEKGLDKRPSGM